MIQNLFSWFTSSQEVKTGPIYKVREVWAYASIDPRTRRVMEHPVLIYRKASESMFWGLPLSRMRRNGRPIYVPRLRNGKKVSALSQMRTLKAGRLVRRLGVAGEKEFAALNSSIVRLLAEMEPAKHRAVRVKTSARHIVYKKAAPARYERPVYVLANPYALVPRT